VLTGGLEDRLPSRVKWLQVLKHANQGESIYDKILNGFLCSDLYDEDYDLSIMIKSMRSLPTKNKWTPTSELKSKIRDWLNNKIGTSEFARAISRNNEPLAVLIRFVIKTMNPCFPEFLGPILKFTTMGIDDELLSSVMNSGTAHK